jgi:hypothetical protein
MHILFTGSQKYPVELLYFGLDENALQTSFRQCTDDPKALELCWRIQKGVTATNRLYRQLHKYLQKWHFSQSAPK